MTGLYTGDILRLAADSAAWPRLEAPSGSAEKRSPTCGSRIIADIRLDEAGRVTAYGHEVRACALGQASSTVLAKIIAGKTAGDLAEARETLAAFLKGERDEPGTWPGLDVFAAARAYPARHAAILLPFEAAADAAGQA